MKLLITIFLAVGLLGCGKQTQEDIERQNAERQKEAVEKINILNDQLHICDNNGGVQEIINGRYGAIVYCKNGTSKNYGH